VVSVSGEPGERARLAPKCVRICRAVACETTIQFLALIVDHLGIQKAAGA